jgi:hypothetical protein
MDKDQAGESGDRVVETQHVIKRTQDIDFDAVRRRLDETAALVARHRVTQEKLDLEISI